MWFLPDGTQFAEYADGVLIVRNRADGRELWRGALPVQYRPSHFPLGLHPIAIDPKGRLAMSGVEEFPSPRGLRAPPPTPVIVVSPGDSAKDAAVFELDQSVGALEFSPGGRFLAISGGRYDWRQVKEPDTRRVLTIWDAVYKRRVGTFPLPDVGYVIAARFSPDGRSLALAHQPLGVVVVETATWQVRASFPAITRELGGWHRPTCDWDALAWSPDSRTLAVAAPDGGLSVWDITKPSRPVEIDGPVLERAWTDLASDAKAGYAATRTFLAAGDRGVVFLKAKIAAAPAPDAKHLAALVTDLGSDDFRTREDATRELNKLGRCAGPALRAALRTTKSPEAADRMKDLVRALDHTKLAPDDCRVVRAVEATEWIGTPEALKLLERWATGAEGAFLTTEARGSFDRRKR